MRGGGGRILIATNPARASTRRRATFEKEICKSLRSRPSFPSRLQDLSVDTLFASIGQELRKLHFRVTCSEMIRYMVERWSVSGDTFGGKYLPSR